MSPAGDIVMARTMIRLLYSWPVALVSWLTYLLTYLPAAVWRSATKSTQRDTSWEHGRELIFSKGIPFWEEHLRDFGLKIEGAETLEVGSGNGQWLIALDSMGAARVVGVEPNEAVRTYSERKLTEFNCDSRIDVLDAPAESLPFADASFDIVLCLGVFMFTRQQTALREFERVLKPGGQLILTVNGLGYFLMKAKDGILFSDRREIRYGISGLLSTLIKWTSGKQLSLSAVNTKEMRRMLESTGYGFEKACLHNDIDLYALEHFGFPTNYAFRARKNI